MARYGLAGALIATAVIVTACGGDDTVTTISSTSTETPKLGAPITFQRADNGNTVGTIRFHEAVMVPTACLGPGDQALAVRVGIDNPGELYLPAPDSWTTKTIDNDGRSRDTEAISLNLECESDYPEISRSDPGHKTEGWALLKVQGPPAAIEYSPLVAEPDSTIDNMKFVAVTPMTVQVPIPALETAAPPVATTTLEQPTTVAPPPVVIETQEISYPEAGEACDTSTDTWATDSAGGQLRCAFAGGPTSKWVQSAPFIGIREEGSPCDMSESGVAETADGIPMVCVGSRGDSVWMPRP